MTHYDSIEDAVKALLQKYGTGLLENTSRFIALLSDYAPNHSDIQYGVRAFARSGGMVCIADAVKHGDDYISLFSKICEYAVLSIDDNDRRRSVIKIAENISASLNDRYSEPYDVSSIYDEGMNYYRRFPKEKYMPVALILLEKAADLGNKDALMYISSAYLKGKGIPEDTKKGMRFLNMAAENGNVRAGLDLAEYLWKGINTEKDVSRAVKILKTMDDSNAQFMLGEIFRENSEYDKAFMYYQEAAGNNNVYAQYAAAIALATGQGTKRDMAEAKRWLRSAASLGHSDARKKLEELGEKWDQ